MYSLYGAIATYQKKNMLKLKNGIELEKLPIDFQYIFIRIICSLYLISHKSKFENKNEDIYNCQCNGLE